MRQSLRLSNKWEDHFLNSETYCSTQKAKSQIFALFSSPWSALSCSNFQRQMRCNIAVSKWLSKLITRLPFATLSDRLRNFALVVYQPTGGKNKSHLVRRIFPAPWANCTYFARNFDWFIALFTPVRSCCIPESTYFGGFSIIIWKPHCHS